MNLAEANAVIARFDRGEFVSPAEYAAASVFAGTHYSREHREKLRPVTFTADGRTIVGTRWRDQAPSYGRGGAANLPEVDPASPTTHGAMNARGEVSGKTIGRLPRSAASYALVDDQNGGCMVIEVGDNDDSLDPGAISTGTSARMHGSGVPSTQTGDAMRRAEQWRRESQPHRTAALSQLARAAGAR